MEEHNEIIQSPDADSNQSPEPVIQLPPEPTDAEIGAIVKAQLNSSPIFDETTSFCSPSNWARLEQISDYLIKNNSHETQMHQDLLFCYHLLQRAHIENYKLKKKLGEVVHEWIKCKLLSARTNLAGRFM